MLRKAKGGQTDKERGEKIGTQRGDAGVERDLGIRLRETIQKPYGREVEAGGSICLYWWEGNPITETRRVIGCIKSGVAQSQGGRSGGGGA